MTATQNWLERLLRPRSLALFGGKQAQEVVRQCRKIGFAGPIWLVHPKLEAIEGAEIFRSVAELPAPPDAAFVAVNRHLTTGIIRDLAQRGAGGAVCFASGYAESGEEGAALQVALIEAAGAMPIIGPNCYGMISYLDGVTLWPDQHGGARVERGVAIITQSGNIGLNLTMQQRGLPIAFLATLGNQVVVGLSDMIEAFLDDSRVTAIGLHIEAIDDPVAFARAAARARDKNIPIVALKTGRSEAGAKLTVSHTASLAGADAVVDAFLRRVGVVRVNTIPVLLETLKILHVLGPLPGRSIATMSCSGGEAALLADAVEAHDLYFGALDEASTKAVAATLPDLVTISNPLDYHTFSWANEAALTGTFQAMLSVGFDVTLLVLDFPRGDRCDDRDWDISLSALKTAQLRTGARAGVVATLPESMPEDRADALVAAGLVPLLGVDEALAALAAAADAGAILKSPIPAPITQSILADGPIRTLSEWNGKQVLSRYGVPIPTGRLVSEGDDVIAAAEAISYPVALKIVGETIAHKTEIGGVKLGLRDAHAVGAAAQSLRTLGSDLLVEQMVTDAVGELIVGVNRDPSFGLYLVIGTGGTAVELMKDTRLLLIPATRTEIIEAVNGLKLSRLLTGYRGKPHGDIEAVADAVLAIQGFAIAKAGTLVELDVNPLMVRPAGLGVVAADVLIRLAGRHIDD